MKRLRFACGGLVVAGVLVATANASSAGTRPAVAHASVSAPVPSLTPAATQRLWAELVRRRNIRRSTAACTPLRAVFYAPTDWLRLATKLAARPSPCAQYYVSVPPLAADKTQLRGDQAWRIRALGPAFHALAEINVTGWTSWVAANGGSWYAAGVEARRRMASAGYDVSVGDAWALNELSTAVRQGTGNARANMRAFLHGLHDGDGTLPATRGAVFAVGLGQATTDLSLYQARLQDWFEDEAFWTDLSRFASDWAQELYGDVRTYAVPGLSREGRRDALNEYLQHQASLASAAPTSAAAARTFLAAADSPLGNAAWRYDALFGWTDVPVELMQDYVSAQIYAARAAGNARFGFAWSPKNLAGAPTAEFTGHTDALLVRLAAAIADSGGAPEAACGTTWCTADLAGAAVNPAWRTFTSWKPSQLVFTSAAQTLAPGAASAPLTIELRTHAGTAYTAGAPVTLELASASPTAELAPSAGGPWTRILSASIASGSSTTSFYLRDSTSGSAAVTATAAGKTAASQAVTVTSATAPPPVAPVPSVGGGTGGGGPAPDLVVEAATTPTAPAIGDTITYVLRVRNVGGHASRARVAVQMPPQLAYSGSQSDRGPGCAGAGSALACDLDFLAGDLVATVRIFGVVREAGTLTFAAVTSAEPADIQPANDTVILTTVVAQPVEILAPARAVLTLSGTATRARVTRRAGVATLTASFAVGAPARIQARVTRPGSTRPIRLLAGTVLAGTRIRIASSAATAAVPRAGAYVLRARIPATKLLRGRTYLVRLIAAAPGSRQRTLTLRVRA